ncbi:lysozyme, partial [Brevundimonas sp.]|uniref:lysozyme n=1 Tax=Brevundimonas sp. TaxID=1871086 RepID=UPI0028AC8726
MSDVLPKPSKVSREGVLLIKSFEGFRPRAMQRSDGRWVIGYGHTQSAREGASVSEAEAELLMQYDLIPVVKAVTDHVRVPLNQHQFDALASFAFSIGADRFAASDVVAQLNAGSARQASASMSTWADEAAAETPTRRRSAEHALFNAAPGAPVTLADLLAAPLPSPFET